MSALLERLRDRLPRPPRAGREGRGRPPEERPGVGGGEQPTELERIVGWFDERTGMAYYVRTALRKVFPDHWSFLLGEIALSCFLILVLTGVFLAFFYVPDALPTTYQGPYAPLQGTRVSTAFESVLRLSFEVRAGLVFRQIHHWTALVFVAVIALHMSRVFFTGAFRRPRELNWLIGIGLLTFALAEGITGYSLPDDLLSGTGLRIVYSAVLSVPLLGPSIAFLFFGGEFPTATIVSRLFVFHVMLLPVVFGAAIALHILLVWLQKHTQFRGPRATEENVVGSPFWPIQAFRSVGLFFLTAAVLAALGGLVEINPVWSYGPFIPYAVTVPAQPDWYVGWLEGALRLGPSFEPTILGITIPTPFIPGILVPGLLFTIIALWPFIEARMRGDQAAHHLLDRPWEAPVRTATGLAVLSVFLVQTLAGGNDVLGVYLGVSVETLTRLFQVLQPILPLAIWVVTYLLCREWQRRAAGPHPPKGGVLLRRDAGGGFVDADERARGADGG
jgi:ubiquinol-cytochrome c reductase cytochrome b subunit